MFGIFPKNTITADFARTLTNCAKEREYKKAVRKLFREISRKADNGIDYLYWELPCSLEEEYIKPLMNLLENKGFDVESAKYNPRRLKISW